MDLEYYLIEQKEPITAINKISKMIDYNLHEITPRLIKCGIEPNDIYDIVALNKAVQMAAYCMRLRHRDYYLKIDKNYQDKFDYDSIIEEW